MGKIIRRGFLAAVIAATALGGGAVRAQAVEEPPSEGGGCLGRISWLTGKCTYCEWGGRCGGCIIEGCTGG
jgi:hypothetical protein